jgi:ClpP class serine protease
MSESLNHDMFAQLVRAIAEGRHKSEADVRALIDGGPFPGQEGGGSGLVDGIAYEDELDDLVPVLRRGGEAVDWVEANEYTARRRRRAPAAPPRIAVLYAVGTIVSRPQRLRPDRRRIWSAATPSSRTSAAFATTIRFAASSCASTAPAGRPWRPT